jgi:hypothetical protein
MKKLLRSFEHYTSKENRSYCDYECWSLNAYSWNYFSHLKEFCLFINRDKIFMFFYVDDIVFVYRIDRKHATELLINKLKDIFEMRNLDILKFFLDVRIIQDRETEIVYWCKMSTQRSWSRNMKFSSIKKRHRSHYSINHWCHTTTKLIQIEFMNTGKRWDQFAISSSSSDQIWSKSLQS